ncbi:MAG: ribose-phosphate diphosphokinase [Candidatus Hodarchaeaceae archaeon]|nr:ribose-phosphate diphosphokinase [Candidatus Hodarchaeaceae archaeon]
MIVVSGSASPKLSARVAKQFKCQLVRPELWRFPDSEFYLRIGAELKGEHAVVVQSTCSPQNDNLVELCFLLDAVRDLGARRVTAVVPYLAYARQDKRFKPGEAISLRTVSKLISNAGADEFITVDIHEEETVRNFSIPAYNLTAMPLLSQYLSRLKLKDPAILGADQGAAERAKRVALELGAEHDYLEKRRISPEKVVTQPKRLDVAKRDVVIVDDIISTGGTIVEAAKILRRQGARNIYAACTHPVLAGKALQRLRAAGVKRVIATDTIEHKVSVVSVAPLIAKAIH